MTYNVVFEGVIRKGDLGVPPPDEFLDWVEAITVELMTLNSVTPAVSGSAEDGTIDIHVVVNAKEPDIAVGIGGTQIRTAAHAAGLGTPGWDVEWVKAYAAPGEPLREPEADPGRRSRLDLTKHGLAAG